MAHAHAMRAAWNARAEADPLMAIETSRRRWSDADFAAHAAGLTVEWERGADTHWHWLMLSRAG
jgi:hypothetical protein